MKYTISYHNLPPTFDWLTSIWLLCITVKVWDMNPIWYWVILVTAVIFFIGTIVMIKHTKIVDIFKGLDNGRS